MVALRRLLRHLALAVATGLVTAGLLASHAFAAEPTFGRAEATAEFGKAITVEQQATLPEGVHRIEAYVREGPDGAMFLAGANDPGSGNHVLRYRHPTPFGGIYPNTRVQLGFRVTLDDGSVIDSPPATIRYEDTRFAWDTLEGDLVRVHWYQGGAAFGRRALDIGEEAVRQATALLGVTESDPIDYFIYADTGAFRDVLGPALHENVGGIALPEIRTLFANIPPSAANDAWVGVVVPHELTHLVFDTATNNPYHEPPHWLNEGLAVYLSEGYAATARANVQRTVRLGEIMPLRALVGQFPSTAERFGLAYDESVSAIDYLIRTHGQEALVTLIRSYADGVSDDAAFSAALGVDAAGFEAAWLANIGVEEPVPYGPLPAPPGPLPPDWAAAPSGGPAPTYRTPGDPIAESPAGAVVIGVFALVAVLLVLGLVVVARQLSRGAPLLAPLGREDGAAGDGAPPEGSSDGDDAAGEEPRERVDGDASR